MSRSHHTPRRRGWLMPLILIGAVFAGVFTALYPPWESEGSEGAKGSGGAEGVQLAVHYRNGAPASAAVAKPWLEVVNTSKKTVALSDVSVRYYFSADGASQYGSNCFQTYLGCSHITQKTGALSSPAPDASHYLEVGFSPEAGSLAPGKSTEAIGLQLYRLDHKELNQKNDHSFDATATHFTDAKKVTAYVRGALAWGKEPGGADKPTAGTAGTAAAAPEGVLFDSFHYTGADDPALAANGWRARTSGGGPGIRSTWSKANVSFPSDDKSQEGQALQLRVTSDGTKAGTRQSELENTKATFFTGTLAARVYFSDRPAVGRNGDHINESFFAISPDHASKKYSELDYEYMPNGGWGAPGPRLDTTSWGSSKQGDRATRATKQSLRGWHTLMITAMDGKVSYSVDGREVFSAAKGFPRERMGIHFSAWLVDLPFKGPRTWNMLVDWVYGQSGRAMPLADVQKAVDGFHGAGTHYVNTLPKS
ncbi:cellulose binding domain-containing protein [Streptomyces sp. NPDC018019]|uniref:cellulose binding domain-containing protein n=1 Tax=Streptomyces sp. NPDC018019 TaxID=3365030 RepID=UPI003799B5F5